MKRTTLVRGAVFVFTMFSLATAPAFSADLRSRQSGSWSAKETWDAGRYLRKATASSFEPGMWSATMWIRRK